MQLLENLSRTVLKKATHRFLCFAKIEVERALSFLAPCFHLAMMDVHCSHGGVHGEIAPVSGTPVAILGVPKRSNEGVALFVSVDRTK